MAKCKRKGKRSNGYKKKKQVELKKIKGRRNDFQRGLRKVLRSLENEIDPDKKHKLLKKESSLRYQRGKLDKKIERLKREV